MDSADISQPLTVFLDWVKGLIPKDKFKIFVSLFRFPTQLVQLSNTIFNELERVFDSKNPSNTYQFTDSFFRDDWEYYRQDVLHAAEIWRRKGWEAMKTSINSVLIVDLPEVQTGDYPEPYFYFLDISNVIDYEYVDGKINWITFRQPNNRIAVFDDEFYSLYALDAGGALLPTPVFQRAHLLGYCPAQFFWTTPLSKKYPDIKKSPLSPQLANMDWLLFFSTSKKHLDLYAPYPIYSAYAADCDFQNNETGEYCDGGYLRGQNNNFKVLRDGVVQPCPVCSEKRLAGAGSFIDVPVPADKNAPDLRDPVTITTVDKDSLDYNVNEIKRLAEDIFTGVVGFGGTGQHKQSINEKQVLASFESKVSVLNSIKGNLENARKFVDDTMCRLRYGDYFISSNISMGTEFYIYTISDLYEQYKLAKTNGASDAELDAINEHILMTEHRNNPMQMQRMYILKQLEPYRHFTFDELMELQDKTLLDKILLQIKINFSTFVNRFERENTNIIEFGLQLEFDSKINIILEKFKEYVRENQQQAGG